MSMRPNVYAGGMIDRAATQRRDGAWLAARLSDPGSRLVPLWRSQNLVEGEGKAVQALRPSVGEAPWLARLLADGPAPMFLGLVEGQAHFAIDLSAEEDPVALLGLSQTRQFIDLRRVGALLPQHDGALLAYARGLAHWHVTHRFCGRCGAPAVSREGGHMRLCSQESCATEHFPRTDPAVIVLVTAGRLCLLGRQARWPSGMYSTLAGFVEPGESLEEAVAREVMEEAGVPVVRLRYHSSQPWPFPGQLMLGFTAEADQAIEPQVDSHELESAAWFSPEDLAGFKEQGRFLPDRQSIARRLIEDWLTSCEVKEG